MQSNSTSLSRAGIALWGELQAMGRVQFGTPLFPRAGVWPLSLERGKKSKTA